LPRFAILAWQPLLRPPLPNELPPMDAGALDIPLKALACRNQVVSTMALVVSDVPVEGARINVSDLASESWRIPASAVETLLVGAVPTPEAGPVCDPLYPIDTLSFERSAALFVRISVPSDTPAGLYQGEFSIVVDGDDVASTALELEVANVDLPDVHEWDFFLNVWMNPAAIAGRHGVDMWSDEHFRLLEPYVADLALHGQKTVVAPICYQPWGTQTRYPYPNLIRWTKRGNEFEFDFSVFDRYVRLHEEHGIDRAIHCYSIAQGPGGSDHSVIEYTDASTDELKQITVTLGTPEYADAWGQFFRAFEHHLAHRDWLDKTFIGFDEKPGKVMEQAIEFVREYAAEFKIALAGNTREEFYPAIDDLSLHIPFDDKGVAQFSPPERSAMGVAQLLDPENSCALTRACPPKATTTFYVCCGPEFPNTFVHSPLVESRMLPWLALQGGFDGFLRWSYNDWPDDPYQHPEFGPWPTGDAFLVYPGEHGPISSLRWEQLREGIQDYMLAMIASANIHNPEEMVDYEQALRLACRCPDGRSKSVGDIEIARRLLIPIAEHMCE
jgi:hypothetical protein